MSTNPLDVPDTAYGRNPRELSQAVRRSAANGGTPQGQAQPSKTTARSKPGRNSKAMSTTEKRKQRMANDELAERFDVPAGSQRKGGPGKRRPTPKRGGGGRS